MFSAVAICSRCLTNTLSFLPASFAFSRALNKNLKFSNALNLTNPRQQKYTQNKYEKNILMSIFFKRTDCTQWLKSSNITHRKVLISNKETYSCLTLLSCIILEKYSHTHTYAIITRLW